MCGIIDVNVLGEALGGTPSEAGPRFVVWASFGGERLVVSRELLAEVGSEEAKIWLAQGVASNRVKQVAEELVVPRTEELRRDRSCRSDDEHIVALGQVSKARLLYTNDGDLQSDFTDAKLINSPRGKVYSTRKGKEFRRTHERLLNRRICAGGC